MPLTMARTMKWLVISTSKMLKTIANLLNPWEKWLSQWPVKRTHQLIKTKMIRLSKEVEFFGKNSCSSWDNSKKQIIWRTRQFMLIKGIIGMLEMGNNLRNQIMTKMKMNNSLHKSRPFNRHNLPSSKPSFLPNNKHKHKPNWWHSNKLSS